MAQESREQRVFQALADPTRRQLLQKLSLEGRKTATQLAREMPITRQGISKHLAILARADLVRVSKHGRDRYYSITPEPLEEAVDWVTAVTEQWDRRLEALGRFLANEAGDRDDDES